MSLRNSPSEYSGVLLPDREIITEARLDGVEEERQFKLIFGALNMAISRGIRDGFERVRRQQEAGQVPR